MTETNLTGTTPDITVQNIEALKLLFPEICSDRKIDFDKLQQLLGKEVDTSPELYNLPGTENRSHFIFLNLQVPEHLCRAKRKVRI